MQPHPKSSVDAHVQRDHIVDELRRGVPVSVVAKGYGLSRTAVSRFRKRLMREDAKNKADEEDGGDDVMRRLRQLYTVATNAIVAANDSKKTRDQLGALKEARACLGMINKLMAEAEKAKAREAERGIDGDGTAPPPDAIYNSLMTALEPHPEARADVVSALTKLEAEWRPADVRS